MKTAQAFAIDVGNLIKTQAVLRGSCTYVIKKIYLHARAKRRERKKERGKKRNVYKPQRHANVHVLKTLIIFKKRGKSMKKSHLFNMDEPYSTRGAMT